MQSESLSLSKKKEKKERKKERRKREKNQPIYPPPATSTLYHITQARNTSKKEKVKKRKSRAQGSRKGQGN